MVENNGAPAPSGQPKRKIRNYLIDRRFQMKYALLLSGASAVLMGAMGAVLYLQMQDAERRLTDESDQAHEGIAAETGEASRALRSEMEAASRMLKDEMDISAQQLIIRQIPCVVPSCPPCAAAAVVAAGSDGFVTTQASGAVCDVQTCRPLCEALGLGADAALRGPPDASSGDVAAAPAADPAAETPGLAAEADPGVARPGPAAEADPGAGEADRRRQEEMIRKIEETVRAETEGRAREMEEQTRARLGALESATRVRLGVLDEETQRRLDNLRAANRREMQAVLISLLVLFVILILLGIVVTHRVAGPIYKMKMLMAKIDGDHLRLDGQLRRGDELKDLFEGLSGMLDRLRDHQRSEIADLGVLIERLRGAKDDAERSEAMSDIETFRDRMEGALASKS